MKFIGLKRLAGLALAAAVIGGPFAGPALAQNTTAPAKPALQRSEQSSG
ncbi:MAG: hypothetical protein JWP23_2834 [Phenylobacterium sp.]|nr:hypothetical protein [Phenylobacterium sp.]